MTTYTTVYVTPPWGVFSKVDCSTTKRVRHHRKIRLRKALGEKFPTPVFWAPALQVSIIIAVDISTMENRPRVQGGGMYTVGYVLPRTRYYCCTSSCAL